MTTQILSFGNQLTTNESLQSVSLVDVYARVTADANLQRLTERLRSLRKLDADAYRQAKTRLPYVVGSAFAPNEAGMAVRRTEQFTAAHYLILDLDACAGLNGQVPEAIRQDEYVSLAFVSPSGAGLKLFFRLLDPVTDARQYSMLYRAFASDWAERNRWATGLDLRTSDVTRACFLAHDSTAYHNPDAMPVDGQLWLDADDELSFDQPASKATRPAATERPIDEAAYHQVLRQVNPNSHPVRRAKQTFVPEPLVELEPSVRALCDRLDWTLATVQPLNYGLKFGIRQGVRSAEINVYWGKRGFSLAISPKTGSDPALSSRFHEQLFTLLFPASVATSVSLVGAMREN